jgi:hypothetical protein
MIALASVGGNEEKGTKQAVLIARDSQVDIALVPHADFEYANDSDSIVWTGDITNAAFAITVRPTAAAGSKTLRAQILVDGKPLGQIMITLTVAAEGGSLAPSPAVSASIPSVSASASASASALSASAALPFAAIASAPSSVAASAAAAASVAAATTMPPADSALPSQTLFFRSTYVCHAASSAADLLSALHWRVMATAAQPQLRVSVAAMCESPLRAGGDGGGSEADEADAWAAFDSFVLLWSAEV